jgi:hypothetical protein
LKPRIVAIVVILAALVIPAAIVFASGSGGNCDSYGDCVSMGLSVIHGNPGGTFYPGDSFAIILSPSAGINMSIVSTKLTYNTTEFGLYGNVFTIRNGTGTFSISATTSFHGINGTPQENFTSTLTTAVVVVVDRLVMAPTASGLSNVTMTIDKQVHLLRNPDGSFYRNDSFCITWSAPFNFATQRPDINVTVQPVANTPLTFLNSTKYVHQNYAGKSCFSVAMNAGYGPYNLTLAFHAINTNAGMSIAHVTYLDKLGIFTVVQYQPYFAHYTYMEYNNLNTTSYQRPFATIVRYDGNNPGFAANYAGNLNTDPITAVNDTRERAWINNFNFTVTGYKLVTNYFNTNLHTDSNFTAINNTNVTIRYMNSTKLDQTREMTWGNRYYKYYFIVNNPNTMLHDVYNESIIYFDAYQAAQSTDYAGSNYTVFTTIYAYNPIMYNGNLTFQGAGPHGPDPNLHVKLTLTTPFPLNRLLMQEVNSTFNNDPRAIRYIKPDLSNDAYNYTEVLQPISVNQAKGEYSYLINQTTIDPVSGEALPSLTINVNDTVNGNAEAVTYTQQIPFVPYMLNPTDFPTAPTGSPQAPSNTTQGYYMSQALNMAGNVLNMTAASNVTINSNYQFMYNPGVSSYLEPLQFPESLSTEYPFIWGENTTIPVNMIGGYVSVLQMNMIGNTTYQAIVYAGVPSGGIKDIWVGLTGSRVSECPTLNGVQMTVNGTSVCRLALFVPQPYNQVPFTPAGYTGPFMIKFSVPDAGTYVIGYDGAWGSHGIANTFVNTANSQPPTSNALWGFATFLAIIVILVYFLGRWFKYRPSSLSSQHE